MKVSVKYTKAWKRGYEIDCKLCRMITWEILCYCTGDEGQSINEHDELSYGECKLKPVAIPD